MEQEQNKEQEQGKEQGKEQRQGQTHTCSSMRPPHQARVPPPPAGNDVEAAEVRDQIMTEDKWT